MPKSHREDLNPHTAVNPRCDSPYPTAVGHP